MDQPSWTDSLRFALSSCLPCFAAPAPTVPDSPPPSYAIRRARVDELESLLQPGDTDDAAADTDAISLHSHLGPRGRRKPPPRAPRHITLWGYSLFGRPPGVQLPPDDADATPDPLHAPSPRRQPSDGSTARLFSADAPPVELSADHIDAEAARRARRRARKEMRRLAAAVADPQLGQDGGEAFEGFQGSGDGVRVVLPHHTNNTQYNPIPAPFLQQQQQRAEDDEDAADLDGLAYARLAPRGKNGSGTGGSRSSGSGSGASPYNPSPLNPNHTTSSTPAPKPKKRSKKSKSSATSSTLGSLPSPTTGSFSPTTSAFPADDAFDGVPGGGFEHNPFDSPGLGLGVGSDMPRTPLSPSPPYEEEFGAFESAAFSGGFAAPTREALPSPGLSRRGSNATQSGGSGGRRMSGVGL
ncbi:hypothetical protein C8J57DRAFT_1463138 [Mycena rebaudengoi]|nr:hypothetical protein C8J57DRAFT_1463138 [Mycena rebaudengoi]